jgi:LysM repeat protein
MVEPGDSLWSIALEVAPTADPRDVVDEIVRLNALGSSTVEAGQRIAIPVEFSS